MQALSGCREVKSFLIDAGGNATAEELSAHLKEEGCHKIDILIGHPPA